MNIARGIDWGLAVIVIMTLRMVQMVGILIALCGVWVVALQCFGWLETSQWVPHALGDEWPFSALPHPRTSWQGLQKMIDGVIGTILAIPLSLGLFGMGFAVGGLAHLGAEELERTQSLLGASNEQPPHT